MNSALEPGIEAPLREQIAARERAEQRRRRDPVGEPHGQLETLWGPVIGRPHWLYEETLLGSGVECDVWIEHDGAAAAHALLTRIAPRRWTLRDLGTRTGTFVGDDAIQERTIGVGDEIRIGSVRFRMGDSIRADVSSPQPVVQRRVRAAIDASRQREPHVSVIAIEIGPGADATRTESILQAHAQPVDTIVRWEPTRFVIVLPGEIETRAAETAHALRTALAAIGIEGRTGVAAWSEAVCRSWEVVALAQSRCTEPIRAR